MARARRKRPRKWFPPRFEYWKEIGEDFSGHPLWIGHKVGVYRCPKERKEFLRKFRENLQRKEEGKSFLSESKVE